MFEFGDELIIESYRIPWLIWIQLLAMFLLVIIILFYTTTDDDDVSSHHFSSAITVTASPSVAGMSFADRAFVGSAGANTYYDFKIRENEIKETGTSTSEVVQRARKQNTQQIDGSSTSSEGDGMIFEHSHHPCHIFGLAKQAFLKCLGIDSAPESSTKRRHDKND